MTPDRREGADALRGADIRFRVDPGDVPPEKAARRLHLTLDRFNELLPNLLKRGFPPADPDTGMFDLDQIDEWRKLRFGREQPLTTDPGPAQPEAQAQLDMTERFLNAKERQAKSGRGNRGPS
ncbi:hypothetical protein ACVW1C_000212 [Bradyrhizobium sp. USDA 4011]|uniref:Uncharacterized protein n=1 Tax=Bradyrhizobium erythrophlei TaxID=1437360 RepID=A0A1H4NJ64_9BRAD|nr:hypothetical protein [Bradyrhizobium erythrophlei]SEB95246.1 hypothetical protein SAMN05444164_0646 [Bradyrhizobium erythrophlei]